VEDIRAALRAKVVANCSPKSASNASTVVEHVNAKLEKLEQKQQSAV
jgi:hypothetical protein